MIAVIVVIRSLVDSLSAPPPKGRPTPPLGSGRVRERFPRRAMSERLQPGDTAPAFTLPDADGNEVSLADHLGRKVIVYFYPAALTPGCTKQACDFTDNLELLAGAGYDVIGVSPDKPEKLAKFREKEDLKVTLVGDPEKKVLEAYGAFGEKKLYGKTVTGVIRSTVVVDEEGKVERALYNVKATGHVAKIIRDLGVEA
ncbi:peroxiredoxin [Streptomyces cinereoruber]|uniref:thioredoxin-dependent peroxiredoxin n=2 Tax=Streptomyces cinereoruber TaxID=67260 RepID=A0AAV4KNJ6_9ACTN|nr:peroxiredoxin [Streptomyces cinereoruber]